MSFSGTIASIEILDDRVRVALVKTGGGLPKVLKREEVAAVLDEGGNRNEALVVALRKAMSLMGSKQPLVSVLCVSAEWGIVRRLTVPFRGYRKVASAVRFELEPHLAIPIEDLVVGFSTVKESAGKSDILAIGIQRRLLENQLQIVKDAGIYLEGIGIDALGMSALWFAKHGTRRGTKALLHFRGDGATLVALRDGKLLHVRHLPASGSRAFGADAALAAREIKNALRAFEADSGEEVALEDVQVTGWPFGEPDQQEFEAALGIPVNHVRLVAGAAQSGESTHESTWDGIVGVAQAATGGPCAIDFLEGEQRSSGFPPGLPKQMAACALLLVTLFTVYWGLRYAEYTHNVAEIERLGQEVWGTFAETFPDDPQAEERPAGDIGGFKSFEVMQAAADDEQLASRSLSPDQFSRPTLVDLLQELTLRLPANTVSIKDMRVSPGKNPEITLTGEATSSIGFDSAYAELKKSKLIVVKEDKLKRSASGGKETFVIVATY